MTPFLALLGVLAVVICSIGYSTVAVGNFLTFRYTGMVSLFPLAMFFSQGYLIWMAICYLLPKCKPLLALAIHFVFHLFGQTAPPWVDHILEVASAGIDTAGALSGKTGAAPGAVGAVVESVEQAAAQAGVPIPPAADVQAAIAEALKGDARGAMAEIIRSEVSQVLKAHLPLLAGQAQPAPQADSKPAATVGGTTTVTVLGPGVAAK